MGCVAAVCRHHARLGARTASMTTGKGYSIKRRTACSPGCYETGRVHLLREECLPQRAPELPGRLAEVGRQLRTCLLAALPFPLLAQASFMTRGGPWDWCRRVTGQGMLQ